MMQIIQNLLQVETMITLLAAGAAFATVITIAAPFMSSDKTADRMKLVTSEREKLKAAQKALLELGSIGNRLRDKKSTGLYAQIVNRLRLKNIFDIDRTRDRLRGAGLRSERHLTTFLAASVLAPLALGAFTLVEVSTTLADRVPSTGLRLAAALGGMALGYYLPIVMVKNIATKRQKSVKSAWSDALDLLLICIESGMALEPAMQRVSKEIGSQSIPLAEEMQLTVAELAYLPERRKALENLAKRTNLDTVKSVVTAMIQAERYGTPLGTALRVLAEENRKDRMAEAERKAAALPPKLTVPMILFFLPVIFVVILGPAVIMVMKVRNGG
ncbi:MAG: type II secretion system F family protein [Aestuariivirga sp.]